MGPSLTEARIARRQAALPRIHYPPALPISRHTREIATAIRDHQVVVVAGETGSGKTTQLPKICLDGRTPRSHRRGRYTSACWPGCSPISGYSTPRPATTWGARGARLALFPGSALLRKPPRWVMVAELVETSRLWGRTVARIEPQWVEPLAGHLVNRSYSEPHWERRRGAAVAYEKVTLYGVPIVASRKVDYARIDPALSRELFLRHALVEGDWETRHAFFHANRALLDDVDELERRARRRDIGVDDEILFDFYDQRIPAEVVSARHFDSWWRTLRRTQPTLLDFDPAMLITGAGVSKDDYPDCWVQGGLRPQLSYQFEPGADADGVTVEVPLQVLNQLEAAPFSWQIPGLRGN